MLCLSLVLTTNINAQSNVPRRAEAHSHGSEEKSAGIKIDEIKFIGASVFSSVSLSESFRADSSIFFSSDTARINTGLFKIQSMYYSEGYLLFKIDSSQVIPSADSSIAGLTIYLSEGPRLLVGKLLVHGNKFFSRDELTRELATRYGQPFDQDDLEKDIDDILAKYNAAGFPLAKVSIDSIFIYRLPPGGRNIPHVIDSLGIALSINEGDRMRIDAIRIEGNTETKDYVILRALRIPPGSYYNEDEMIDAKQRLQKLGFFQNVSDPELFESGDTTGVIVKVIEGNTNTFDGVIGYMPAQLGQQGYLTGLVDVSMTNLFGTGRKFRAMWHQETKLTQELEIGYSEPYIFGYPINAELDFSQREQDSTSVTRNLGVVGTFIFSDNFNANASLSTISTTPLQIADSSYSVFQSNVLDFGLGITLDTRDDLYSPRHGVLYQTQVSFGQKKIYGPAQLITSDVQLTSFTQHLSIDFSFFHELFPKQIFAIGFHGEQVTGTELDQSDMYRLGGTNTIRGYIENQFLATKAAWTNIEYRFSTGRESFFFGFVDAGYIYEQSDPIANTPESSFSVYGYGVGAQVETGIGILKASYALGKGDSFIQGKIHFGIVNQF
ncbi:MAG: outer membrane protein assembly factor [Candidatus Kryptoniota bacterium]